VLVCHRCKGSLDRRDFGLFCPACNIRFPFAGGIPDFSEGAYYDNFEGPEFLTETHRRGLENEHEGARIEDFYLPLLRNVAAQSADPLRVLDSGCGNGESIDALNRLGVDAWGHDLSALRKWQWSRRERPDRLVVADGASLPFPDGFFGAVIASGVLEHIGVAEEGGARYRVTPLPDRDDRRRRYLRELVRVTAPRGHLFLDFPNGAFPIDFWHGVIPGGARFHSRNEGFLPTVSEVRSLFREVDPRLQIQVRSPEGRLRFRQVSAHWYGRLLRRPMALLHRTMSTRTFRFLAASSTNPFLVIEVTRERSTG
jgi:SAM-dependent methyltransferase